MKWIGFLLLLLAIPLARSQPREVIIIRHGEEPGGNAIHLSARGQRRAEALVGFFQTNSIVTQYGVPVALFAARPMPNGSRRSEETLIPTSRALGEPIRQPFTQGEYSALVRRILGNPAFKGKTVVIAWTHTYIPRLAAAFGVSPSPPPWNSSVYDRAFVLTSSRRGVMLRNIPQHLLPGDSKR